MSQTAIVEWTTPQGGGAARDCWIIEPSFRMRVFHTGAWCVHAFAGNKAAVIAQGTTIDVCNAQAALLMHEAARMESAHAAAAVRIVARFVRELPGNWPVFRGAGQGLRGSEL